MDVRIGVIYNPKEIVVELAEGTDRTTIRKAIDDALSGATPTLWLTDAQGGEVGIPSERIAFVEVGAPDRSRRVGFGG